MADLWLCFAVFVAGYVLNMTYITVFYHRALAHSSVTLRPWLRRFVVKTGVWVTGIDPKGWATMHRLHHKYSDTPKDPHSPLNDGIFGLAVKQLESYKKVLTGLVAGRRELVAIAADLDFPVSWVNRKRLAVLPYVVHAICGLVLAFVFRNPLLGISYFAGMMSHPIQGWLVNSFAHAFGYTNFQNGDHSRNNTLVAWLVMGEGYQNNHHRYPNSPNFAFRWFELDLGYVLCLSLATAGLIEIHRENNMRAAAVRR